MKTQKDTSEENELPIEELFLLHLRYKEARLVEAGGNNPILLNDPQVSWVVYRGWADVFAVPLLDGKVVGSRTHLFRASVGQAMFGMALGETANDIGLLVVGSQQTSLLKINTQRLHLLTQDGEFKGPVVTLIDNWVKNLLACLSTVLPPKECLRLEPGAAIDLAKEKNVCARRGVLWLKHDIGRSYFVGDETLPHLNGKSWWPISEKSWIQTAENSQLDLLDTQTLISQTPIWPDLEKFHQHILHIITQRVQQTTQNERGQIEASLQANHHIIHEAFHHLVTPLTTPTPAGESTDSHKPLLEACSLVAKELGIQVKPPAKTAQLTVAEIARASRFQIRRVALRGEWWKKEQGPLLAFQEQGKRPLALLPNKKGYWLVDPTQPSQRLRVTQAVVETLDPFAYMFYRSLPAQAISVWELVRFGLKSTAYDFRTVLFMGGVVGLLGVLVPMATGFIFDEVIPNSDQTQLTQLITMLLVAAGVMALFQMTQNLALLRLQGRLGNDIQAAIWERTLSLPVSFFRDYSTGDLGTRVMGISAIQQLLSGTILNAMLAGVFSIFSFFLLFYYSTSLALVATLLVFISATAIFIAGRAQIRYQRVLTHLQGKISSHVLQTIEGITKFRASGAEGRAFATWAKDFSQHKQTSLKARNIANNLQVFNSAFQVFTLMVIFGMVAVSNQQEFSTGDFLAFNTAFTQFLISALTLSGALVSVLNVVPIYERSKPILQTLPEVNDLKEHPGELNGRIEVSNVSFRYTNGPDILKDVSVEINPGEFIALVGPSGSGKSTLFRLLLGFETPDSGAIYYDGQDLSQLDIREVRRQLGVVLQNGQIMAGDIFTNIVGANLLTTEDAMRAARMAGLADDLKNMPMGLHTVLSHGGSTLSGGQRQRLLIARAIVTRPRILFFDEATSALDSHTQSIVSESLDNLQATRVVIAHRLSTIKNADKIYVLQNGRVVQQGTYTELIRQEGAFAELAKRQLA